MINTVTVSWFSAGVSSAVATKLAIDKIDHIIYQHIDDQHPDTMRFVKECEAWFGKPVEIQQHPLRNVEAVCDKVKYIKGPHGAPCTGTLKKYLRHEWERQHVFFNSLCYVWGMDSTETKRADRLKQSMFEVGHIFPLIEAGMTKEMAHGFLANAGIKRPAMYDLGYRNNNCVGCVKGGMGYWNKIRVDFPVVFANRAAMERRIGASCIKGMYLDELDPEAGRDDGPVVPECGAMCDGHETEQP